LGDLEPIQRASWLVSLQQFSEADLLSKFLSASFEHWEWRIGDAKWDIKQAGALNGGLVLRCDCRELIRPACCGDLSNWNDWKEAAIRRNRNWEMLWIGHPWRYVRFDDQHLIITEPTEDSEPLDVKPQYALDPSLLESAIDRTMIELRGFAMSVFEVIGEWTSRGRAYAVSRRLAGLSEEADD
jgi:hypothetical protein